jgi:hypothetical protein
MALKSIQSVPGEYFSILRCHSIGHSKQKLHIYVCPIPNGFQDRAISLYSSKIVNKGEVLRTASSTGVYCSSDKIRTVYIVQFIITQSIAKQRLDKHPATEYISVGHML